MVSKSWTSFDGIGSTEVNCTLVAVQLHLRTADASPAVDTWTRRVTAGLPAPGLLGFMVERTEEHLRTVSAWQRRAAMAEFERSPPHLEAKKALHELIDPATVVVWSVLTEALPPQWPEVRRRLAEAEDRQRSHRPSHH